jgi:hypothetical protein
MRRLFTAVGAVVVVGLCLALTCQAFDDKKPDNPSVTDPDKAGPDYAIQGEYVGQVGTKDSAKWGAEVIARGDGKFAVNFLPGGLRGEGGDYAKHVEATAQTDNDKTTVTSKDGKWSAVISGGRMTGDADGQAIRFERVVRKSKTLGEKPPADAVVLFDGKDASEWPSGKIVDGNLLGSDIDSKKTFKDCKAHVEFRLSFMPKASGQGRSNSGVYLQHRYEIQVLDSFGLKGENNECGGIYSQLKPLVNMCYPPLTWQTYDVDFTAAKFDGKTKTANAVVSLWHNGVLIHDKAEIMGPTGGGRPEEDTPGPLHLQGHGGQVQYRNIWVVEKK